MKCEDKIVKSTHSRSFQTVRRMREAWKTETYVRSQSFSSESAVKYLQDSNIPSPGRTRSFKCPTPGHNQIPTPTVTYLRRKITSITGFWKGPFSRTEMPFLRTDVRACISSKRSKIDKFFLTNEKLGFVVLFL